jgi:hypothetical protein
MKQRGRIDSVTAAVGEAAGVLRRRREGRQPHIRVHDGRGGVETLEAESPRGAALLATADAMVDAVDAAVQRPATGGKSRK